MSLRKILANSFHLRALGKRYSNDAMESDLHILFADVWFYLFVILASASPTSNINTESTLTFTLVSNIQTFTPILQDEMLLCHLPEKQNKIFEISGSSENYTIFVNTTRIGSKMFNWQEMERNLFEGRK